MQTTANQTAINIVWIFFVVIVVFLVLMMFRVMRRRSRSKARAKAQYESFKEEYDHLTPAKIDACDDKDLPGAIIMQCQRKEEEDENYIEHLNEVEKTVYGIYNINSCLNSSIGLRSFFITPANQYYADHVEEIFNNVASPEIAKLMAGAKKFNDIMENDLEDDEADGEYGRYNFSDFTQDYKTMITGTDFSKKVVDYIRKNKDQFKEEVKEKKDEVSR